MTIRPATPEDAEGIAVVDIASHQAAYSDIFSRDDPSRRDLVLVLSKWQDVLSLQVVEPDLLPTAVLVAADGDEVVGYSSLGNSRDDDGHGLGELFTMYVTPDRWRQGVGHQLMRSAIDWLSHHHFEAATLWVLEDNVRAQSFYEKEGWQPDGARVILETRLPDRRIAEVRYRQRLV